MIVIQGTVIFLDIIFKVTNFNLSGSKILEGFDQSTCLIYTTSGCWQMFTALSHGPFSKSSDLDKRQLLLRSHFTSLVREPRSSASVKPRLLLVAMLETLKIYGFVPSPLFPWQLLCGDPRR